MKVKVQNLGVLRQAEFETGDFTIICGENNTGKTYATYALYGFLDYWRKGYRLKIDPSIIQTLFSNGTVSIPLKLFMDRVNKDVSQASKEYSKILYRIFASEEKYFKDTIFEVFIRDILPCGEKEYEFVFGSVEKNILRIDFTGNMLEVTLLIDKNIEKEIPPRYIIETRISEAIKDILYSHYFPNTFIASAERTGSAIFRKELDFARNRLLEAVGDKDAKIHQLTLKLLTKFSDEYALPVTHNVDFTRQLESIAKKESFITKKHPDLLEDFSHIIGGEYRVIRNEVYYHPKNKRIRLTMDESSSGVRSMVDIGFYLRHIVQPGDLFMVDEPELNLHPQNQRRIARLFARLVNLGIKVFITTHSDYIIKELNTLIMLNHNKPYVDQIREEYGYKKEELISASQVKVYIAEEELIQINGKSRRKKCHTLVPASPHNPPLKSLIKL